MNLRIIPAVPTAPTVIFSLNWRNLPSSLPFPQSFSSQLVACRDNRIQAPKNSLALDRAVGLTLLIESVTFDLTKDVVVVACVDGQVFEWSVNESEGFKDALDAVLKCVKDSGVEAEKEKKAATASTSTSTASQAPSTVASSGASTSSSGKRHRTATGIFSSFVAAFVNPPPSSIPATNVPADTPPHLAHLYAFRARRKASAPTYHRQHMLNPINKREQFPNSTVPHSRYLRRQARARLVDIFRLFVANKISKKLRDQGIIGEELKTRGVLDDLEDNESGDESGSGPAGVSGYQAAGGYVGFMARSMLKKTIAEINKDDDDSYSSSDDSVLLTPRDGDDSSIIIPDLPSLSGEPESKSASTPRVASPTPSSARSRRPSSPQSATHSRQLRHLSSVLIGMAQKDKRIADEERQLDQSVMEKSLRKRWSASEMGGIAPTRTRSISAPAAAFPTARARYAFAKPAIGSPLKNCEVLYRIPAPKKEVKAVVAAPVAPVAVPFPGNEVVIRAPQPISHRRACSLPARVPTPPLDEDAEEKHELAQTKDTIVSAPNVPSNGLPSPKAKEAEDVADVSDLFVDGTGSASNRARCTALLANSVPSVDSSSRRSATQAFPVDVTDAFDGDDVLSSSSDSFRSTSSTSSFPVTAIFEDSDKSARSFPYTPAPEPTKSTTPTSPPESPFRYEFAPRPSDKNSTLANGHSSMRDVQVEIEFHESEGLSGRGDSIPFIGGVGPNARSGGYWSGLHDGIYVVA